MTHTKIDKRGFSLIEMMTAIALAGMVLAGVYTMYFTQTKSHATQQVVVDMQQGIRLGMFLMEKEIRMAGYDPTNSGVPQITSARRASITFTMDITGGETDGFDNDGDGNWDTGDLSQDNFPVLDTKSVRVTVKHTRPLVGDKILNVDFIKANMLQVGNSKACVFKALGIIPLSIIMFRMSELRHKWL